MKVAIVPARVLNKMRRWDIWTVEHAQRELEAAQEHLRRAQSRVHNAHRALRVAEEQRANLGIQIITTKDKP